jgi:two-component system response regulator FixJ
MPKPIVLVIDDDPAVRHALEMLLREEGFAVETYASGPDCLDRCAFRDIACAIVDYHMPEMTGVELVLLFRTALLDIPVILLSSMLPDGAEKAARDAGIHTVMRKPPNVEELCAVVRRASGETL